MTGTLFNRIRLPVASLFKFPQHLESFKELWLEKKF